jgi:ubiquinone/menaquinone biosynthesis C-methylase UbiE
MNIAVKDKMYAEARRVLKHGGIFAVYNVMQGEGGEVLYPVPWARALYQPSGNDDADAIAARRCGI